MLECHTNYHHNYAVQDGYRQYYHQIPQNVQVGEHQFIESRLIRLWISNMVMQW